MHGAYPGRPGYDGKSARHLQQPRREPGFQGRAIRDYNQAIHLNSNATTAYLDRGDAYFAQSNRTAAISDFEHTISPPRRLQVRRYLRLSCRTWS